MEVTKPYEFIGFGAMEVTKPYEFIGFGAMEGSAGSYVTTPRTPTHDPEARQITTGSIKTASGQLGSGDVFVFKVSCGHMRILDFMFGGGTENVTKWH